MSQHKFTADRSDKAHRIKQQLLSGTAIKPPPEDELNRGRWGEAYTTVCFPTSCGKTDSMSLLAFYRRGAVLAGFGGDGQPIYIDTSSTDD